MVCSIYYYGYCSLVSAQDAQAEAAPGRVTLGIPWDSYETLQKFHGFIPWDVFHPLMQDVFHPQYTNITNGLYKYY
jgi:hypothetical protein